MDWMLYQQERIFSLVRRYEAPDEYPFFAPLLPSPILQSLTYPKLLHPNTVNINDKIKTCYIENILPAVCRPGVDRGESKENYGSSATMDVNCLQALSRRIHFGKFVAEVKFREDVEGYTKMINEKDVEGLDRSITNAKVEEQVLKRLELKARTYGCDPSMGVDDVEGKIDVKAVVNMYKVCFLISVFLLLLFICPSCLSVFRLSWFAFCFLSPCFRWKMGIFFFFN